MEKHFLDVTVGDIVVIYDENLHDYIEHRVKIASIEENKENATKTNPKGRVLYGEDLTFGDDDELMLGTVYESNFIRCES
jgi:hypothetical protein